MENSLVTLIFPLVTFDSWAEKALTSAVKQTYSSIEWILPLLSEDINAQEIESLMRREGFEGNILFLPSYGLEVPLAINEAIKLAKGRYLSFLSAYDSYFPERIEKLLNCLREEKAEWVFSKVAPINEEGQSLPLDHPFWRWKQLCEFHTDILLSIGFKLLQDNILLTLSNLFLTKALAEKVGAFKSYQKDYTYDYALRALFYAEPIFYRESLLTYCLFSAEKKLNDSWLTRSDDIAPIINNYLLSLSQPPENKLAPCPQYWPMSFSTFRLDSKLDMGMAQLLQELESNPNASKGHAEAKFSEKGDKGKVSIFIHELSLSGAPKVAADLALILKEAGYEPNILTFALGDLKSFFDRHQIPVELFGPELHLWNFKTGWRKAWAFCAMAWKMFRCSHPTTIAIASLPWPAMVIAAFLFPFRKFIWYLHDSYAPEGIIVEGLPQKLFVACTKRKNLRFWFGSHATRAIWEKAEVTGDVVYWSGLKENHALPSSRSAIKKILCVGSGYPRKGAHFLIDAFISCVKENKIPEDVTLTIVGFPDSFNDLVSFVSDVIVKVQSSGLQERIFLVKTIKQEDLEELYDAADLYVQPSFMECLPISMLHAMSKGLPVITTPVDGCKEALVDSINGYTCPPRNSKILAERISEAINDPKKTQELGRKGQETFNQKFSLEKTKVALLAEFEKAHSKPAFFDEFTANTNKKIMPLTEG